MNKIKKQKPNKIGKNRDKKGRFLKGRVANPNGRPLGSLSITAKIKEELEKCPEGQDKKTYLDLLVKRILKEAIVEGNDQMIKSIWAYVDGQPKQDLKVEHDVPLTSIIIKPISNVKKRRKN